MPILHTFSQLDTCARILYNVRMEQKYINVRVRKDIHYKLKLVSALSRESMLDTLERLISQELDRLRKEEARNAALQKDQD
jgi:hypothetical protein